MTADEIIKQVSKEYKVDLSILLDNKHRTPQVALIRRELVRRLRRHQLSYGKISELIGISKARVYKLSE